LAVSFLAWPGFPLEVVWRPVGGVDQGHQSQSPLASRQEKYLDSFAGIGVGVAGLEYDYGAYAAAFTTQRNRLGTGDNRQA